MLPLVAVALQVGHLTGVPEGDPASVKLGSLERISGRHAKKAETLPDARVILKQMSAESQARTSQKRSELRARKRGHASYRTLPPNRSSCLRRPWTLVLTIVCVILPALAGDLPEGVHLEGLAEANNTLATHGGR